MISAIANPFLYSYFNDTFKNGLQKMFSLCCPHLERDINTIYDDQTQVPSLELKLRKYQKSDLPLR